MFPSFIKKRVSRVDYLREHLGEFAHQNRELLIIVADPETDQMFVAYRDKMVLGAIKNAQDAKLSVVRDVVRHSKLKRDFDIAIDLFLAGTSELLQLSVKHGNHFYKFIADVLFHFQPKANKWLEEKKKRDEILASGSVVSPIQPLERSNLPANKT